MFKKVSFLLVISCSAPKINPQDPPVPEADTVIYLNVTTHQQAENILQIPKKGKEVRCSKLHGDQLKECVHSLTNTKRKKILFKFPKQQRAAYIKTLTKDEFLSVFLESFSETEWKNFRDKLSSEEKKRWPNSLQEQKDKLKEIKERCHDSFAWEATKVTFICALLLAPVPSPLTALFTGCEVWNKMQEALQQENDEVKKYINEKYG